VLKHGCRTRQSSWFVRWRTTVPGGPTKQHPTSWSALPRCSRALSRR
jgi:hypothetical protein